MTKHTVVYRRKPWDMLLACICPQIMSLFTPRLCRKYSKMPGQHTHRLVWSTQTKKANPQNLTVNPYYKENA